LEKHNGILALVILNCNHCSYSEDVLPITAEEADGAAHPSFVEFQHIIPIKAVNLYRTVFDTRSNKKSIISAGTHDNMIKDVLYRILAYVTVTKKVTKMLESRMTHTSSHLETYHVALHHVDASKQSREASCISSLR